jgi:hypothetical protein
VGYHLGLDEDKSRDAILKVEAQGCDCDLDDTYMKYLRSNPWLEPMGDEGTYRGKLQFASFAGVSQC